MRTLLHVDDSFESICFCFWCGHFRKLLVLALGMSDRSLCNCALRLRDKYRRQQKNMFWSVLQRDTEPLGRVAMEWGYAAMTP